MLKTHNCGELGPSHVVQAVVVGQMVAGVHGKGEVVFPSHKRGGMEGQTHLTLSLYVVYRHIVENSI